MSKVERKPSQRFFCDVAIVELPCAKCKHPIPIGCGFVQDFQPSPNAVLAQRFHFPCFVSRINMPYTSSRTKRGDRHTLLNILSRLCAIEKLLGSGAMPTVAMKFELTACTRLIESFITSRS